MIMEVIRASWVECSASDVARSLCNSAALKNVLIPLFIIASLFAAPAVLAQPQTDNQAIFGFTALQPSGKHLEDQFVLESSEHRRVFVCPTCEGGFIRSEEHTSELQ